MFYFRLCVQLGKTDTLDIPRTAAYTEALFFGGGGGGGGALGVLITGKAFIRAVLLGMYFFVYREMSL